MKLTQYTIERKYAVTPARLYRAFTDPAEFASWVYGTNTKGMGADIDLKINGAYQVWMEIDSKRDSQFRGIYLVIEPDQRLVHTVHWDADVGYNKGENRPLDEVLVLDFLPDGNGSLLRYRHMGIPDDGASASEHERSVRITLDGLAKLIES